MGCLAGLSQTLETAVTRPFWMDSTAAQATMRRCDDNVKSGITELKSSGSGQHRAEQTPESLQKWDH